MDRDSFDAWLAAYGKAWEQKECDHFCDLFAVDARYYWTPVEEPKAGRTGIGTAFSEAVPGKTELSFCNVHSAARIPRNTKVIRLYSGAVCLPSPQSM